MRSARQPEPHRAVPRQRASGARRRPLALPHRPRRQRQRVFELPFGDGKRWLNGGGLAMRSSAAGRWRRSSSGRAARRSPSIRARHVQPRRPRRPADGGPTSRPSRSRTCSATRAAGRTHLLIDPTVIDTDGRGWVRTRCQQRLQRPGVLQPGRGRGGHPGDPASTARRSS